MTKVNIGVISALLVAGVTTPLILDHQARTRLRLENQSLLSQLQEQAALREENERLSERLALLFAKPLKAPQEQSELMKLRSEVTMLRRETLEQKAELDSKAKSSAGAARNDQADTNQDPVDMKFGPGAGLRMRNGKTWGLVLEQYVLENQHLPINLAQMTNLILGVRLFGDMKNLTALIDHFELIDNVPANSTSNPSHPAIVMREKEPWQTLDGNWAKTYVFADGSTLIHTEPDANFEKWEATQVSPVPGKLETDPTQ
jgi:hypothetical protein